MNTLSNLRNMEAALADLKSDRAFIGNKVDIIQDVIDSVAGRASDLSNIRITELELDQLQDAVNSITTTMNWKRGNGR